MSWPRSVKNTDQSWSVTADNGAEFSEVGAVLTGVADLYYAHPYRS
ncbi:hypothetical protein RYX41_18410 [Lactiplantibacillus plantarum]|nr:hypothetical protein [Lactiplantibacillus plantarum]